MVGKWRGRWGWSRGGVGWWGRRKVVRMGKRVVLGGGWGGMRGKSCGWFRVKDRWGRGWGIGGNRGWCWNGGLRGWWMVLDSCWR